MDRKSFSIKAAPQTDRIIRFVVSDETVDRDGEVLVAEGCDFSEFKGNPQFLGFHDYRDFPLGVPKSWGVDVRAKQVWMNVYFPRLDELATDPEHASEKAKLVDTVYHMYKTGMLNAVSVGFLTEDYEPIDGGRRITKWKLLEVSAVPIPCNPNALVEARGAKSYDPKILDILEAKMKPEEKAGARFSKETQAAHGALMERLAKCNDGYKSAHKAYMKELEDIHMELKTFMGGPENEGGDAMSHDGERDKPEEKPKAINLAEVKKYLGVNAESK